MSFRFGIIGAGEYKQVHDSSLALVSIAGTYLSKLSLTKEFPLPKNGFTRFYVITPSGMHWEHSLDVMNRYHKHVIIEKPTFLQNS